MDYSLENIGKGKGFFLDFDKVWIDKCFYINRNEEKVEKVDVLTNSAKTTIVRFMDNDFIKVDLHQFGLVVEIASFDVSRFTYYKSDKIELVQADNSYGGGLSGLTPARIPQMEFGKISMFQMSKQQNQLVAFLITNPDGVNDYYYRIGMSKDI